MINLTMETIRRDRVNRQILDSRPLMMANHPSHMFRNLRSIRNVGIASSGSSLMTSVGSHRLGSDWLVSMSIYVRSSRALQAFMHRPMLQRPLPSFTCSIFWIKQFNTFLRCSYRRVTLLRQHIMLFVALLLSCLKAAWQDSFFEDILIQ